MAGIAMLIIQKQNNRSENDLCVSDVVKLLAKFIAQYKFIPCYFELMGNNQLMLSLSVRQTL